MELPEDFYPFDWLLLTLGEQVITDGFVQSPSFNGAPWFVIGITDEHPPRFRARAAGTTSVFCPYYIRGRFLRSWKGADLTLQAPLPESAFQ